MSSHAPRSNVMPSTRKGKYESLTAFVVIALLVALLAMISYAIGINSRTVQYDRQSLIKR